MLNLKLTSAPVINVTKFKDAAGQSLPHNVYMPSSMLGWELTPITQMQFDFHDQMYVLDNIPINQRLIDDGPLRFKICGDAWRNQFGFGANLFNSESTFGIPDAEVVVQVERFPYPVSDAIFELPQAYYAQYKTSHYRYMRVEFKVISIEPTQGLLHITLH